MTILLEYRNQLEIKFHITLSKVNLLIILCAKLGWSGPCSNFSSRYGLIQIFPQLDSNYELLQFHTAIYMTATADIVRLQ